MPSFASSVARVKAQPYTCAAQFRAKDFTHREFFNMNRFVILSAAVLSSVLSFTAHAEDVAPAKADAPAASTAAVTETKETAEGKETVTTTTTTSSRATKTETVLEPGKPDAGSRAIHFEDYDLDHDGQLTRAEAGEMLFRLYDTDGNQVIDDVEYQRPAVLTMSPMKRKTKTAVDDNGDGVADKEDVTEEDIRVSTMLSQYDTDSNGLSPLEFTGKAFNRIDINRTNVVEKKEWQGVYDERIDAKNRAEASLNK